MDLICQHWHHRILNRKELEKELGDKVDTLFDPRNFRRMTADKGLFAIVISPDHCRDRFRRLVEKSEQEIREVIEAEEREKGWYGERFSDPLEEDFESKERRNENCR
jgi:hypothetical protein